MTGLPFLVKWNEQFILWLHSIVIFCETTRLFYESLIYFIFVPLAVSYLVDNLDTARKNAECKSLYPVVLRQSIYWLGGDSDLSPFCPFLVWRIRLVNLIGKQIYVFEVKNHLPRIWQTTDDNCFTFTHDKHDIDLIS